MVLSERAISFQCKGTPMVAVWNCQKPHPSSTNSPKKNVKIRAYSKPLIHSLLLWLKFPQSWDYQLLLHFRALINIIMISITLQLKKFRQTQQEGYKLASQSVKQVDMSWVPDKIYCCADLPQYCAGWSHDYTGWPNYCTGWPNNCVGLSYFCPGWSYYCRGWNIFYVGWPFFCTGWPYYCVGWPY